MRVPEYITTKPYEYNLSNYEKVTVPAGTFVKPLYTRYVPKHVLDSPLWKGHSEERDTFVYCSFGIISMPRSLIREIA